MPPKRATVDFSKTSVADYARSRNIPIAEAKPVLAVSKGYLAVKPANQPVGEERRWLWVPPGKKFHADLMVIHKNVRTASAHYLLTMVDVGSRYGMAAKLKTKTAAEVAKKMHALLMAFPLPVEGASIVVDSGNEFRGPVTKMLRDDFDNSIIVETNGSNKASLVERWHGTLRRMKLFYDHETGSDTNWANTMLDVIVPAYNNRTHGFFNNKLTPSQAVNMPTT